MRILSFDVGAIHLAYCLIHIKPDGFSIEKWNVVNLCDFESEQLKCSMCNNLPKYKHPTTNIQYCLKHCKTIKNVVVPPKLSYKIKKLNKSELISEIWVPLCKSLKSQETEVLEFIQKERKLMNIPPSLSFSQIVETLNTYKKDELLFQVEAIIRRFTWQMKAKKTIDQVTAIQMGKNLKLYMDALKANNEWNTLIDVVVIENQLGNLAVKMMRIQGMITQYFIDNNIDDIFYVPASKKLSNDFISYLSNKYTLDDIDTETYADRKKASISIVKKILDSDWDQYFLEHKKKDDLADCLLQGLSYSVS
jgi:hypothetical protein